MHLIAIDSVNVVVDFLVDVDDDDVDVYVVLGCVKDRDLLRGRIRPTNRQSSYSKCKYSKYNITICMYT